MKKIIILVPLFFILIASCNKAEKPYCVGLVNFISGNVILVGAKGIETPAKVGMPLDNGMKIITTGKKSICEIYFNQNAVKIFGDSTVSVEWLTRNMKTESDETVLVLGKGSCFANVKRKLMKDDTFIIKTPVCVAAVRGTEFFVSDSGSESNISCLEGKVEVRGKKSKNQPKTISGKEEVSAKNGKTSSVKPINDKNIKDFENKSEVKPLTEKNKETFEKLATGDVKTVRSVKKDIEKISGSVPEKEPEKKPDVDLFFFKS